MDTVVLLPTSPEGLLVVVVRRLRRVAAAPVPVLLVALVRLRRTKRRTRRGATMTTTSTKRGSLWENCSMTKYTNPPERILSGTLTH